MHISLEIPSPNLPKFTSMLDKFNTRAKKLGLDPITYDVDSESFGYVVRSFDEYGNGYDTIYRDYVLDSNKIIIFNITVTGETPILNGWKFISAIDHIDGINIIRSIGDEKTPSKFDRNPFCDHCGTKRVKKYSFVIKKDDEYLQVGKGCLKNYFDSDLHSKLSGVQRLADLFNDWGETDWDFVGGTVNPSYYAYSVRDIIATSVLCVERDGFSPASSEFPTKDTVRILTVNSSSINNDRIPKSKWYITTDDHYATADKIIEWIENNPSDNEFMSNVKKMVLLREVNIKFIGYGVGVVGSYFRELKNEAKKTFSDNFVGVVKKRQKFVVSMVDDISFDGYYGTTHIYIFKDNDNNKIVWKTGNSLNYRYGLKPGDDGIELTGTVKNHTNDKYGVQTELTRCKIHAEEKA